MNHCVARFFREPMGMPLATKLSSPCTARVKSTQSEIKADEEITMNYRFAIAIAAIAFIAGCNTMHGVGEDVSAGGRKVEDVLKKDKSTGSSSTTTTTPSSPATTGPSTDGSATPPSDTSMSRPPSSTTTQ